MSSELKESLGKLLQPLLNDVLATGIMNIDFTQLRSMQSVKDIVLKKSEQLKGIMSAANNILANYSALTTLAAQDPKLAMLVMRSASTTTELEQYSRILLEMGKDAAPLIAMGGKEAILAAVQIKATAPEKMDMLKNALRYGNIGLTALKNGSPVTALATEVDKIGKSGFKKMLFNIRYKINKLPWLAIIGRWIICASILIWIWRPQTSKSRHHNLEHNNDGIISICPFTRNYANSTMDKSNIYRDFETTSDFLLILANQ